MKINKYTVWLASLVATVICMQITTGLAQNTDTRKGYDLHPGTFDSLSGFIARYYKELPKIVAVCTKDQHFIQEVKAIIKDLDEEGIEQLTLLLYAPSIEATELGLTHSVIFLKDGELKVGIEKIKGKWGYTGVADQQELSSVIIQDSGYPLYVIRTQISSLFGG